MKFTIDDLKAVYMYAIHRTALSLGVLSEGDPLELEDAVSKIVQSKGHKDALDRLCKAYSEWYRFHLEIFQSGKSGKLSPQENEKLKNLILERDEAKKMLLEITPIN
jgi:hypothetical protein